ncbi:hypothetical protein NMY22_g870 [Coprinellus aureogranulatus]|nr:hypothetical protein NMY22_g870 [Coprinellus aureogranulatus]
MQPAQVLPVLDTSAEISLLEENFNLLRTVLEDLQIMCTWFFAQRPVEAYTEHVDTCGAIENSVELVLESLTQRRKLGEEEWNVRTPGWHQKYTRRMYSLNRTLFRLLSIRPTIEDRVLKSHQVAAVLKKLQEHQNKMADLARKFQGSFDRLKLRHIHFLLTKAHEEAQQRSKARNLDEASFESQWYEDKAVRADLRREFYAAQRTNGHHPVGPPALRSFPAVAILLVVLPFYLTFPWDYHYLLTTFTKAYITHTLHYGFLRRSHRPTWDPAQAKDSKAGSRQFSVRDMASHTKLKFRQVGQTSVDEVKKRDLRAELLAAEREAVNKKRKAEGKPPLPVEDSAKPVAAIEAAKEDEESNKRRKLLQEALELDKDGRGWEESESSEEDESEEESDDEDEEAELLRELEKIKRERAEEKARQEREQSANDAAAHEADVATRNPLLNLAAALGQSPNGINTTVPGTFQVKRRWDDDLIFKNQAMNQKEKNGQFVNDLLRTEFHKKFMAKFIK